MTVRLCNVQATLRQIVARASMPLERLEAPFLASATPAAAPTPEAEARIQSLLDEWAQSLSPDRGHEALQRFLAWAGLDMADARRAVAPVCLPEDAALPPWAELLGEVLAVDPTGSDRTPGARDLPGLFDPENPQPFEDLLLPFVLLFQERLAVQAAAGCALLSPQAQNALGRALLARLAQIAAETLYLEFRVYRTQGMGPLAQLLSAGAKQPSRTVYRDFVQRTRAGFVTFLLKYPVLARLLATRVQLWTEAHVEFLRCLAADLPDIARTFKAPPSPSQAGETVGRQALGPIAQLYPALSDPHRGGRTVLALRFACGLRLAYKPKDVGLEVAYNHLLAWLNVRGALLDFKVLRVLNRGAYGWVEFAPHDPCPDAAAIARYYRRAGQLLCLAYVLGGVDCHAQNLVASGETPVLVDAETLLHHHLRLEGEELAGLRASAQFEAHQRLERSVLSTGLLPVWEVGPDEEVAYDASGLGGDAGQALAFQQHKWTHVNTDRMALSYERAASSTHANLPHLEGAPVGLDGHQEDVVAGFEAMFRCLLAQRALLSSDDPLRAFKGQQVRFVFRPTQVYALILKQAAQPAYLQDGARYGLVLETLARAHLLAKTKPSNWPILRAERRAMGQLDVPFFHAQTDSEALLLPGGRQIAGYFYGPSYRQAVKRLRALDEADLAAQVELIRLALSTRHAGGLHLSASARPLPPVESLVQETPEAAPRDPPVLSPAALVAEAVALARALDARAIRGADGSATWIAPQYLPRAGRFRLRALGPSLYDGLAGVAFFLAALTFTEGSLADAPTLSPAQSYRELCLGALQPLRRALRAPQNDRVLQGLGIGGAVGLGSALYALAQVAGLLDEPALLEEARRAVRLLTAEHIAADSQLDVINGAAGAVLGLLAVYKGTQDALALQKALECGRHLLARRAPGVNGLRAWNSFGPRPLTGFSHGAAGIAYALLRLYAASGETAFRAAAQEAIAYEDTLLDEAQGNWPDLRTGEDGLPPDPAQPRFRTAWCHGAPGIGLARLGGLPALDTPAVRRDIAIALETTQRALANSQSPLVAGQDVGDHLCCGHMGRIELLLAAGQRLARPDLVRAARREAAFVVARAQQMGGYRLSSALPRGAYSPGLFQGAAGVGYELLRLAYPERLSSVLLWAWY